MHEMSLCQSLFKIINQQAIQHNCSSVSKVTLVIGELANVDKQALAFAFSLCQRQQQITINTELGITDVKAQSKCRQCNITFHPQFRFSPCPQCDSLDIIFLQGDEFKLQSMEAH